MGYAVLSDVHSNLEALNSAIKDLKDRGIRDLYFLGDAVGYGPDPNESVELLNAECKIMIAGNHDWGAVGLADTETFNENAKIALAWTRGVLKENNSEILKLSPLKTEIKEMDITLVHASPHEPEHWHYLMKLSDAETNFKYMLTALCFVGHSHKPFIMEMTSSGDLKINKFAMHTRQGSRYIINAGSIGQPRDGDPRACYAVVDKNRIEIIRVFYDIRATQERMRKEGLPLALIERLAFGV